MSVALVAGSVAVGAAVGALTPRIVYRISVPYGSPSRSACDRCARPFPAGLTGWVRPDLRCPNCRTRLGPPGWPCVTAGGLSFGLLAWAIGPGAVLPAYLIVAGIGVLLAFVDVACLRLPDPLVGGAFLLGGGWLVGLAIVDGAWGSLGQAGLGAFVSGGVYLVLAALPGANLGFGDVKLAGVLGFLLGWLGWPAVGLGLALPHLLNGPVAVVLLLAGRVGRRGVLPLGPALLVGALLAIVLAVRGLPTQLVYR